MRPIWGAVCPMGGPVLPMGGLVRLKWGGDLNMGTRECGGCLYVAQSLQYYAKFFARHASVDQTRCFAHLSIPFHSISSIERS